MDAHEITVQEGKELVRLARISVESFVKKRKLVICANNSNKKSGIFVTIYHLDKDNNEKNLRGCIGYVLPSKNIYNSVVDTERNDATQNTSFIAVCEKEIEGVI